MCITYKSIGRDKNASKRILEVSCARDCIMSCTNSRSEYLIIIKDDESRSASLRSTKRQTSSQGDSQGRLSEELY